MMWRPQRVGWWTGEGVRPRKRDFVAQKGAASGTRFSIFLELNLGCFGHFAIFEYYTPKRHLAKQKSCSPVKTKTIESTKTPTTIQHAKKNEDTQAFFPFKPKRNSTEGRKTPPKKKASASEKSGRFKRLSLRRSARWGGGCLRSICRARGSRSISKSPGSSAELWGELGGSFFV